MLTHRLLLLPAHVRCWLGCLSGRGGCVPPLGEQRLSPGSNCSSKQRGAAGVQLAGENIGMYNWPLEQRWNCMHVGGAARSCSKL